MRASYWMPAEECWTWGLHEPVQSKNGYSRTIRPVSSLCFESRVTTSSASCIPLILLPEYSAILVYASDICLAAAVSTERQPGAGILPC